MKQYTFRYANAGGTNIHVSTGSGTFVLRMAAIHYSWSPPVLLIIERTTKQ